MYIFPQRATYYKKMNKSRDAAAKKNSPQLSSILLTLHKFKVWMTIVESGWNVLVWLVGVVSRMRVWLVGVVSRMWVESMGVASGCGCKEVY